MVARLLYRRPHGRRGARLIEQLRRHHPGLPIVVVTMLNNAGLFHAILELGVMGLLSKASLADELPEAIRQVRQQRRYVRPAGG